MKYNYALAPTKRNPRCDKLGDEGVVSRHPAALVSGSQESLPSATTTKPW